MSRAYTSDGKRISSMTHAKRAHHMDCGRVVYGNGGYTSHQKAHGCRLLTREQWLAAFPQPAHVGTEDRQ